MIFVSVLQVWCPPDPQELQVRTVLFLFIFWRFVYMCFSTQHVIKQVRFKKQKRQANCDLYYLSLTVCYDMVNMNAGKLLFGYLIEVIHISRLITVWCGKETFNAALFPFAQIGNTYTNYGIKWIEALLRWVGIMLLMVFFNIAPSSLIWLTPIRISQEIQFLFLIDVKMDNTFKRWTGGR